MQIFLVLHKESKQMDGTDISNPDISCLNKESKQMDETDISNPDISCFPLRIQADGWKRYF
jgi:hypothetical protein